LLSPLSSSPSNSFLVLYPWSNLPVEPGRSRTPGRLQLPYPVRAVLDLPPPAKSLHRVAQPRHRGPLLVGQPTSMLPTWTRKSAV
jgi:hypothetical protein